MSEILKKERDVVLPGDEIINSMDYLPGRNCYREGNSIYSKRIGLLNVHGRVISVIPLSGVYIPKPGDMVIGKVEEIQSNGWIVDINSVDSAYLPLSGIREFVDTSKTNMSKIYSIGDIIYSKINVANASSLQLSMMDSRARKFRTGRIERISPAKVPRLIGKDGSMINLIKDKTNCRINVGQNGLVWFEGEKENLVSESISIIERDAIYEGLTDRIAEILEK